MSLVLAIDTAASALQLALLWEDGRCESHVEPMATGHAERLFSALNMLFARAGSTYSDLGRIGVTTGPGSFTGLRIGLSAARGFGLALGIPVLGVSSLLAQSLSAHGGGAVSVLFDARRDQFYRQDFLGPGVAIAGTGGQLLSVAQALLAIDRSSRVLGSAAALATEAVGAINLELTRPEDRRGLIEIEALARFVQAADPALFPPEPNYIRGADAKAQEKFRVPRRADRPQGATP